MKNLSLKTKITIHAALVFLLLMLLGTFVARSYFHQQLRASVEDQLFTTVSLLADELNKKVNNIKTVAHEVAGNVTPQLLANPREARAYLEQQFRLMKIFAERMTLFTVDGEMVATTHDKPGPLNLDRFYHIYLQKTAVTGAPFFSEPVTASPEINRPLVVLTIPIFGPEKELIGVFAGSIDLLNDNILGFLSNAKLGQTGFFQLFTQNRTMIVHPDPSRIMLEAGTKGDDPLFDRAIGGFEGTGETLTGQEQRVLAGFKRLPGTNWILAATFPVSEALAPVKTALRLALIVLSCGWGICVSLMWIAMRHLIKPILSLTRQLRDLAVHPKRQKRVAVSAHDETVELAESINNLMEELEKRETDLARHQELFQILADWSTNWIFWESPAGEILYVSPAASRISGYPPGELRKQGQHFNALVHPEDRALWKKHCHEVVGGVKTSPLDIRILTKTGEICWLSHSCQPVLGENGKILGIRGSLADISERKVIEEQLRFLSTRDGLTGLYSRGFFNDELDRISKGRVFPVTLMMADLDGLKMINDTLGHATGDHVIRQAARLLQKTFRTDDVVARIGGDEFAVLMPGVDETAAVKILQRFRRLEAEHNREMKGGKVAFSVGAFTAADGKSLATAMEKADARMYRDKERRKQKSRQGKKN